MASLNRRASAVMERNHEGQKSAQLTKEQQLRRSVLSCLLWEKEFYEDGVSITERITTLVDECDYETTATLAYEARKMMHLRHVPLLLLASLAKKASGNPAYPYLIRDTLGRADEMAELLSIYWRDGRKPVSAGMKKGLAMAFNSFSEFALARYQGKADRVKLKDVMAICHPNPTTERKELYASVKAGTLAAPDTWEVNLSAGVGKKETFTRLLAEEKLGYLALLRNLRGMAEAGVDEALIKTAICARKGAAQVLPFRFIAAVNAAPQFAPQLDAAMRDAIDNLPVLGRKTAVLVDVSGSMDSKLSAKSDLTKMDAACALATFIRGEKRVFSFSSNTVEVPPYEGLASIATIKNSQPNASTMLGKAIMDVTKAMPDYDRIIVITDEESHDPVGNPPLGTKGYMLNVASYKNGIGGKGWVRIDGFSENVIRYIHAIEAEA